MAFRTALTETPNCTAIAEGSFKGSVCGTKVIGKTPVKKGQVGGV
jgi:hypothetical protein